MTTMYIKTQNNTLEKYPYSINELIEANPNTSFPSSISDTFLQDWGVYRVITTVIPNYNKLTEAIEEGQPQLINGIWTQTWIVRTVSTQEQEQRVQNIKNSIINQTQQRLDSFAQTRGYDNILSLCTYVTSTNSKFSTEGQRGVELRDATWTKLYEILLEVQSGIRPVPQEFSDLEQELPALNWSN